MPHQTIMPTINHQGPALNLAVTLRPPALNLGTERKSRTSNQAPAGAVACPDTLRQAPALPTLTEQNANLFTRLTGG